MLGDPLDRLRVAPRRDPDEGPVLTEPPGPAQRRLRAPTDEQGHGRVGHRPDTCSLEWEVRAGMVDYFTAQQRGQDAERVPHPCPARRGVDPAHLHLVGVVPGGADPEHEPPRRQGR